MDSQNKNKANSFEKFLNYFKDLLTREGKHSFEKEMMLDPFEEEAYEGLSQLNPGDLEKDLYELRNKIESRTQKKRRILLPVFRYAVAAVLIFALGTTVLLIRKSVEHAPAFEDFVQAEDSSLFRTKPLRKSEDSLKKNFAFTEQSIKEEEKPQILKQKHLAPAKEIEVASIEREIISDKNKNVVSGTVISSSNGEPIPGVNVTIKGTTIGTISDLHGNYSIEIPSDSENILAFTYVGFATEELAISNDNELDIVLIEDLIAMDEVVVVGYGTMKKLNLTSSAVSVSEERLSETQLLEAPAIEETLQGRMAGVEVEPGGSPGGSNDILIRGTASLKQNKAKSPETELSDVYKELASEGNMMINGTVVSSYDGEPLPGVNVILKGTTTGTVSDLQGNFAIKVPADGQTVLAFNFIGFESEEIEISDDQEITLSMTEELLALDEVVVIGYGTMNESTVSSSVVIKPKPAIGLRKFKDYIQENIRYNLLPEFDKSVVVKLKFTVSTSGDIRNIKVQKSAGEAFDNEAIRIITEGPKWNAGTVDGVVAENEVTLKIKFTP